MMALRPFVMALALLATPGFAADFELSLTDTGKREYYCTATMTLSNPTDAPLTEISGYFYTYVGEERVGRSKGSWFMNVPAGGTAEAVFETPNAPCEDIDRYDFIIGACRIEAGFSPKETCAERMTGVAPVGAITAQ